MSHLLAIAVGGAVGSILRYWISMLSHGILGRGFPYGTLVVNIAGSLLMGLLYVWCMERLAVAAAWRAFLLIGLLGGFTTFSTFSIETVNLLESGESFKAALNVVVSVFACVLASAAGVMAGRQL